ncbi:hypothetical protein B0H10DRAFT_1939494 [Mycena sp. CBHHK59/15]|nr:hypothetical protein B0H10DRAFT_1939494 [Mycena sp. CBHHK59/15]
MPLTGILSTSMPLSCSYCSWLEPGIFKLQTKDHAQWRQNGVNTHLMLILSAADPGEDVSSADYEILGAHIRVGWVGPPTAILTHPDARWAQWWTLFRADATAKGNQMQMQMQHLAAERAVVDEGGRGRDEQERCKRAGDDVERSLMWMPKKAEKSIQTVSQGPNLAWSGAQPHRVFFGWDAPTKCAPRSGP